MKTRLGWFEALCVAVDAVVAALVIYAASYTMLLGSAT